MSKSEARFVIEMNEAQLQVIIDALDNYSRMGMGQLDVSVEEFLRLSFYERYHERCGNEVKFLVDDIKALVFGHSPNSSWSIGNDEVPAKCREAYDIQQVVRKVLAEHRNADRHSVWMNPYMATNPSLPPVKCVKVEPEGD